MSHTNLGDSPDLSGLSPDKRRLVEHRLRARAARAVATAQPAIARRPAGAEPVMSDAQRRLYLLDQSSDDLTAYNVVQALRLRGHLDVAALHRALDDLVARHEVLRTRFLADDGGRVEILATGVAEFTTRPIDNVEAFVREQVDRPFDLRSGVLLRGALGVLGREDHVLVLVTHHIVSDGASKRVLADELSALYSAHRAGVLALVPAPVLQYADYAAWQTASTSATDVQWWRSYLAGAPDETQLPTDRPRALSTSYAGAKHVQHVEPALAGEITRFARGNRATLFMVLLAAFAGLLERYSSQGDVVIGCATSGRHLDEVQRMIGLFLNELPLRVDTSGNPSFSALVDRARDSSVAAYRYQNVPFDRIVDEVRPSRVLGRNPIFQAMLTVKEGGDNAAPRLDGLDIEPVTFDPGWTKFDLLLVCSPVGDGLDILWQYSTALFDDATIRRLSTHLTSLLRAGIAAPDVPLDQLALRTDDDLTAIAAWNATETEPSPGCLHDRMTAQAARTPDALAVGDDSGWITYRELDERSNRLAHHLVELGVRPDSRVAIYLDRSIDLEVAVIAVLKAGGAYVPLDPGYPPDRLAFMLQDCGAAALLTTTHLLDGAPSHRTVVLVDEDDAYPPIPAGRPVTAVTPENLAYVIYTSGTTGRPKGVCVEHRSVVNQLDWMQRTFALTEGDTVLQKTPFSFDVAGWEVLWTPMTGARLFMARPGGHLDARYLIDVICQHRVTMVNFVPSMLAVFVAASDVGRCASLRLVTAAGEALPDDVKDACLAALPRAELHNLYGPTETAITVLHERCLPGRPVTIGRPSANTHVAVVDGAGGSQPIGMPGELWVSGVQVARGYLNRPELTAERFVGSGEHRAYRTGDRASWRPDGCVQYLGRADDQVKLRGFRIELGEIEAVLATHPAVARSCVVVATAGSGDPVLAAYVVLRDDPAATTTSLELATLVRKRLPDYMVPSSIRVLEQLPLTPAGKLDRRELSARSLPRPVARYVAPSTPTQIRLATLWQEALGLDEPASAQDSFFDLGGNSLLALTLFPRIERAFRTKLALSMLFENVTIESQAAAIDAERTRRTAWSTIVVMRDSGSKQPLFVTPELRGDVLTYRQLLSGIDPDRPVYGIECVGLDGRAAPRLTIEAIAQDCIKAMQGVQPTGPYLLAGYCFGGVVAYEIATRLLAAGEQVEFLGVVDATPYGRGVKRTAVVRPTLRERFTIRSRQELRRKVTFVREVTGYRVNLSVSALCDALRVRTPHRFVDVRAANMRASRSYVTPDSPARVTLFRASTGSAAVDDQRRERWEEVAKGGVQLHPLAGEAMDHYAIIKAEQAIQLAEAINSHLADLP